MRIVLADEDREALGELAALVERLGHEPVAFAVSVAGAVGEVVREDADLALVRLHGNEHHALQLIEELSEATSGPVIAVLDEDDADFVAGAAEAGVSAYAAPMTQETLSSAIELAVRRHAELEQLTQKVDQLQTALDRRALIERAKGILMERHGLDEREAFELMRSHARSHNRKVLDVSRAVAEGHALLPPGGRRAG